MEYTGVKIFSNSFSASVKREYRTIISFGIPDDEAEAAVLDYYQDFQDGLYSGPFWLGLAQAEADCGRLSGRVKAAALAVLERGDDLELWRQAVELEPDYKRMMKDRRLRAQWQRDVLVGIQKHDIDIARETKDEIRRAEHRTNAANFDYTLGILKKRVSQLPASLTLPEPPEDDGWRPNPLLVRNMELDELLHVASFGIEDDTLTPGERLPDEMICQRLLFEILWLSGSAAKNLARRQAEHTTLKAAMEQTQIPKKVSKPYFIPSPWQEGDIFWYRLRSLPEQYAAYEGMYGAIRIVAVRGRSISLVKPELGSDDRVTAGYYGWVGNRPPTMADLEKAVYLPIGSFMGTEAHGIWLSLYCAKKELKKWEWKVIGGTPNFSRHLPPFFCEGSLNSFLTDFGERLARELAEALERNGVRPPNVH